MVAAALLATVAIACTSRPEDALMGKWEEIDGIDDLDFHADGTVTIGSEGALVGGNYRLVDGDHLEVSFGPAGGPFPPRVVRLEIDGDELTVFEEDRGKVHHYRRPAAPD
jgi:hypothetical protein